MEPISFSLDLLKKAGMYLKEVGGQELVKTAATQLFTWIGSKLNRKSQENKIIALKEDPESEDNEVQFKTMLEEAIADEEINLEEVAKEVSNFESVLKENDPVWFEKQTYISKTNTQNITGNQNISIQDVSENSSINITKAE